MSEPSQPRLRLRDKRRRLMWVKVAAGTAVVAVALVLVWYGARKPEVTIASIAVSGTNLVSANAVTSVAENVLGDSYFYLVPYRNGFFVPEKKIESVIKISFPEIQDVAITKEGLTSLTISVTERTPVAVWCASVDQGSCYLMDNDGFIFARADHPENYIQIFGTVSGGPVGVTFLNGAFSPLNDFVKEISKATNRTPVAIVVEENDDVTVTFAEGGDLKFVRTADQNTTLNNIASVFASRQFKANEKLEYADFRFGDKVYVKFREE